MEAGPVSQEQLVPLLSKLHEAVAGAPPVAQRDGLIRLGSLESSIGLDEQARETLRAASAAHADVELEAEAAAEQRRAEVEQRLAESTGWVERTTGVEMSGWLIALVPALGAMFGFTIATTVKPILEAYGKAVLGPLVAAQAGSSLLLNELAKPDDG